MDLGDTIERAINISAPIRRVWDLVSVPGWWINETAIDLEAIEIHDGERAVVHTKKWGEFEVELLASDAPHRVSFRWQVSGSALPRSEAVEDDLFHTVVTFTLTEVDGGTRLAVIESGFASGTDHDASRRRAHDANTEGWEFEITLAKEYLEQ